VTTFWPAQVFVGTVYAWVGVRVVTISPSSVRVWLREGGCRWAEAPAWANDWTQVNP